MKRALEIGILVVCLYILIAYAIPAAYMLISNPISWSFNPFELSKYAINWLFMVGLLLSVKGIWKMIKNKTLTPVSEFTYLFMIWSFYSLVSLGIPLVFQSSTYPQISAHFFTHPVIFLLFLVPFLFIVFYYRKSPIECQKIEKQEVNAISKNKRLFHWLLDIFHLFAFAFMGMWKLIEIRADILNASYLKDSATLPLSIMFFVYYFFMEVVFLRTPGKIASKSKVIFDAGKNRAGTILLRTICRMIPLDVFSFLGDKDGWHDSLSKTKVVACEAKDFDLV